MTPHLLICHQAFIETEGSSSTSSEQDTNSAASQIEKTRDTFSSPQSDAEDFGGFFHIPWLNP
jgi:hypothetical protein